VTKDEADKLIGELERLLAANEQRLREMQTDMRRLQELFERSRQEQNDSNASKQASE